MSARKKLRAIMAGKRLVLMPGAYDALSARIIEREGFEALVAGGYAGIGSMLAQADMGQSNMRDYADHYARIGAPADCAVPNVPAYDASPYDCNGGVCEYTGCKPTDDCMMLLGKPAVCK